MAGSTEVTRDDLAAIMTLIDDGKCDLIEQQKKLQGVLDQRMDALWTFLTQPPENPAVLLLEEVLAVLRPTPVQRPWWRRCLWPAGVVLAGCLGLAGGWWQWGVSAHLRTWASVGMQVDTVLVEQYGGLAMPVQQAITKLYQHLGLATPGERKGKRT